MRQPDPLDYLYRANRFVAAARRSLSTAIHDFEVENWSPRDCQDIYNVLGHVGVEVTRLIKRYRDDAGKSRKVRQGSDLALKAQLAKARRTVAEVLNAGQDPQSHK